MEMGSKNHEFLDIVSTEDTTVAMCAKNKPETGGHNASQQVESKTLNQIRQTHCLMKYNFSYHRQYLHFLLTQCTRHKLVYE